MLPPMPQVHIRMSNLDCVLFISFLFVPLMVRKTQCTIIANKTLSEKEQGEEKKSYMTCPFLKKIYINRWSALHNIFFFFTAKHNYLGILDFMMTVKGATFSLNHVPLFCPGGGSRAFFILRVIPAYLWFTPVRASLVCPLPIPGPPFTLRHLPSTTGGHVIALWRGHVLSG